MRKTQNAKLKTRVRPRSSALSPHVAGKRSKNALPRKVSETYRKIYAVVKRIPRGKVASYGQVARVAGMERQARLVGYALHALSHDSSLKVPWQRVINAQGYCSIKEPPMAAEIQQRMLENEGIVFSAKGKVDWRRYGWRK